MFGIWRRTNGCDVALCPGGSVPGLAHATPVARTAGVCRRTLVLSAVFFGLGPGLEPPVTQGAQAARSSEPLWPGAGALATHESGPTITIEALPDGQLGQAYGPVAIGVGGGAPPFTFELVDTYCESDLGSADFALVGTPRNWRGSNTYYGYELPFAFPFYGQTYGQAIVGVDGWINFGPVVGSTWDNSTTGLAGNLRIAPLWDNLRTDVPGCDIFVDESAPGQVTIRWRAVTHIGLLAVNVSATLHADGRIRLAYGEGNTGLTPTVGVAAGDDVRYTLSVYDGLATLTGVNSVELQRSELPAGIALAADGLLSGTPTQAGRYRAMIRVRDALERTDSRTLPLWIRSGVYGDSDGDGDCDLDDLLALLVCWAMPAPNASCLDVFDVNSDGAINVRELATLQAAFTGPVP